jgi:hypothetical protein
LGQAIWLLPGLLALVYLIALAVDFRQVITSINLDGDASVALVLAKLLSQAPPGSHVLLGNHPYYDGFLFLRATESLPFYRQLWEIAPALFTFAATALLGWSARKALGSFAALLTASALVCLSAFGRLTFFTFDWHGPAAVQTIVLAAAMVWLTGRAHHLGWAWVVASALLVGILSGLPLASDKLFPFWALIPLLASAALVVWNVEGRARATVLAFAVITILTAAISSLLIGHGMRTAGITATNYPISFLAPGSVFNNWALLLEGYLNLGGGYFLGAAATVAGFVAFASGLLILAAIGFIVAEVRRLAVVPIRHPKRSQVPSTKLAYISFWTSSLLGTSAVFVVSSAPIDSRSARYLVAGWVAILALVPLVALRGPRARVLVTAGVCAFAISMIYQLVREPFAPGNTYPTPAVAATLTRFAEANHVRYAYASYWDAADLTWLSRFKLEVFPVVEGCGPAGLCAFSTIQINTWYVPRPGIRSLLIADPTLPFVPKLDSQLGTPIATTHIGNLDVAVYPFDIASRL